MNGTTELCPDEAAEVHQVISPKELALLVVLMRQGRKWSQEQLAELSGLTVRTIQRVEGEQPSNVDTRRALARAFEAEDIDCFNKPFKRTTAEEIQAATEKLERDYITLSVRPATGKTLAELAEAVQADLFHAAENMPREAEEVFAALADYWRDYREMSDSYSEVEKLGAHDEMQASLDELQRMRISLCVAERAVYVKAGGDTGGKPVRCRVGYVLAFPLGKEPEEIRTPKAVEFKF